MLPGYGGRLANLPLCVSASGADRDQRREAEKATCFIALKISRWHQVATHRRGWHHQQRPFRLRYHLIIVDTMGHGEVSWPPEEFSLGRTAGHLHELLRWLHELLRWLRAGPAFWVGISMGAVIAMRVARSNPC